MSFGIQIGNSNFLDKVIVLAGENGSTGPTDQLELQARQEQLDLPVLLDRHL